MCPAETPRLKTPAKHTHELPKPEKIPAHLLPFLLTSLGESLCEERERELSLCERSERSDLGEGDLARRLPLLRDGLGEALCRLFLATAAHGEGNTLSEHLCLSAGICSSQCHVSYL